MQQQLQSHSQAQGGGGFAIYSLWRNLDAEQPIVRDPLCFLDPSTVAPEDLLDYQIRHVDRTGVRL